jgi:hypothetical protein
MPRAFFVGIHGVFDELILLRTTSFPETMGIQSGNKSKYAKAIWLWRVYDEMVLMIGDEGVRINELARSVS